MPAPNEKQNGNYYLGFRVSGIKAIKGIGFGNVISAAQLFRYMQELLTGTCGRKFNFIMMYLNILCSYPLLSGSKAGVQAIGVVPKIMGRFWLL